MGPTVLDCFDGDLEGVEIGSCDRAARDSAGVAADTLQTTLPAVVSIEWAGTPAREQGDSGSGKKHGCREPTLGCTSDTRRTLEARIRCL